MRKEQTRRYEMFVRVRNFGTANRERFPESSTGGRKFAEVAEAVATIEEQLTRRAQARAEARKVKATTRAAVMHGMKAIAATGRRATEGEWGTHPFRMPTRKSAPVILSTARLFVEEAERRKDRFVALGMAPTFLAEFQKLVEDLAQAVNLQQDSRGFRHRAQAGIENTLTRGFNAIRDLDVTVANALAHDPAALAQWDAVRRLDGHGPSSSSHMADTAKTEQPAAQPVLEKAS